MKHLRLMQKVSRVAREDERLRIWSAVAASCAFAVAGGLALGGLTWVLGLSCAWAGIAALAIAAAGFTAGRGRARRHARDTVRIARMIEHAYPELESRLMTALEQEPDPSDGQFGFLQDQVIAEALAHGVRHDWCRAVPSQRVAAARRRGLTALACLIAFVCIVLVLPEAPASRLGTLVRGVRSPGTVTIEPGTTTVERGTSLIVTARFAGALPAEVALICRDAAGATTTVPMSASLSDPLFGARIDAIQADFEYHVAFANDASERFRVTVFEYPDLVRADAHLEFPAYTGLGEKTIEDTRRVTAVEGTRVTFLFTLNKPVAEARLVDEKNEARVCAADAADPTRVGLTWIPAASGRHRLQLRDHEGRANKRPPEFVITVAPNRRPDVAIEFPARDMRVSPLEELRAKASVWDDFGVSSYGIASSLAGNPPIEVALGGKGASNERRALDHVLDFEALGAKPDQLFSYYFWAEDIGPDGTPRRTFGDMYFAEVRHFEEIFRQGEESAGGEQEARENERQEGQQPGGAAQRAEDLAERQKQIINATWKVLRRENGQALSDDFAKDGAQIAASQQEVLTQASGLDASLQDAESKTALAEVTTHMQRALEELTHAVERASLDALRAALPAEQAAYQALLALRAREHLVARGRAQREQRQRSASGTASRSQQQLEQLQLNNARNRYETERQARPRTAEAQRENREVLNRVRDLAERQKDVNERMKELQSQLAEAANAQEREELARRLARLREEQQELVRSADELADRMGRPENQERMAESRERLGETRENMRQASQAMEEGEMAQAVARGTRAERELSEMRERFRADAANRFAEEAERLREEARALDANERQLAERLQELERTPRSSLRDADAQTNLGRDFEKQGENLDTLLQGMEETVRASEEAEPLLSRQLYDTLRTARQQRVEEALDATRQLVERGVIDQARATETNAGRAIEELRAGVENAAERVLGDGNEALRRAHETLTDLAQQVDNELQRAAPREEGEEAQARADSEQRQEGDAQARTGDRQPQEGDAQARTGDRQPQEGDAQARTGDRQPQEGDAQARAGDRQPQEGDAQARTGDRQPQEGDAQARAGDRQPQEGDAQARAGDMERFRQAGGRETAPMGGEDFVRWSDRLRDVEDMLDAPDLRAEATLIRERARAIRRDTRSSSTGPNWERVRTAVAEPLNELRDRVGEEVARRTARESFVPIDRDPVPPKYAESVRRYYEELGRGK